MTFDIPFQSSDKGIDVATPSDIALVKAIWGDRNPIGAGGDFFVSATLPDGVDESDETRLLIQRRVNSIVRFAGVSDKGINPIGVEFSREGAPGLAIQPRIIMDVNGNPLEAGGR